MGKRDTIHLMIGADITRSTKTGCGQLLEDCGTGVAYEYRKAVTCSICQDKANKTAAMRGDEQVQYGPTSHQP